MKLSQRLALSISLVLLIQVLMPWHMLHMQAVASQTESHQTADKQSHSAPTAANDHAGSPCHPPAEDGSDGDLVSGFCEWLCAQGQTSPGLDVLPAMAKRPSIALPRVLFGADQLPNSVPTPPPIG